MLDDDLTTRTLRLGVSISVASQPGGCLPDRTGSWRGPGFRVVGPGRTHSGPMASESFLLMDSFFTSNSLHRIQLHRGGRTSEGM